jgi:deoxyribodipyrimidine photo-lyase
MTDTAIHWFRTDLRLHDNPALAAAADADELLPAYVFEDGRFGVADYGGPASFAYRKCGPHRARFLRESVADLRGSLREEGSDLVVRRGDPAEVLPALVRALDADAVHCSTHPAPEERGIERRVRDALADGAPEPDFERHWTHTLHHVDDLPGSIGDVDDTYTDFRKAVESDSQVRETVPEPTLPPAPDAGRIDDGDPPSVADLLDVDGGARSDDGTVGTDVDVGADSGAGSDGSPAVGWWPTVGGDGGTDAVTGPNPGSSDPESSDRQSGVLDFVGGESRALDRLEEYVWERDRLREYKETRNGLLGADYSSKLSAWLAVGCLSPRRVYEEVKRYEDERVANDSTYWLAFELRWRDFFAFQVAKHGATLFRPAGIRERYDLDPRRDDRAVADFRRWARAETGIPFVDANVRELNTTGYVSNRGRQNIASFLANDLGIDWRWGAAYFEDRLVDYDPASNYGNWAYVAGVGNDSRDRSFDVLRQADRYDGDAEYVRHWLPELADLPPEAAHRPWAADGSTLAAAGVRLGETYPGPMVDPAGVGE